jgi:hypothetical protein
MRHLDERGTPPAEERATNVGLAGIEIASQRFGDPAAPAVLMIMGVAAQMIRWPDALCHDRRHRDRQRAPRRASMEGAIARTLAIEHPARVRSLTSIMSTTGNRAVGQPDPEALREVFAMGLPALPGGLRSGGPVDRSLRTARAAPIRTARPDS